MTAPATPASDLPLLSVNGLGKKYSRHLKQALWYGVRDIAGEVALRQPGLGATPLREGEFWAARDISFELRRGEALALIGANGAGKSTVLKMLCGLIKPDAGEVRIRGRLGALIELGAGFDPVLSGRENIYISAAVLSLTRAQVQPLLPKILQFAELDDYIDTPVQFYSSGMKARLSYAVAAHLNPDIFLVDEVLAVGDIDFQRKCITHMRHYLEAGGSLVLISHSPFHIQAVCNRGILLEGGRITSAGSAIDTLNCYLERHLRGEKPAPTAHAPEKSAPMPASASTRALSESHPVEIDRVRFEPIDGDYLRTGQDARLTLSYRSSIEADALWGFTIFSNDQWICITGNASAVPFRLVPGANECSCVIHKLALLAGNYILKAAIIQVESLHPFALFGWENSPLQFTVKTTASLLGNSLNALNQLVTIDVDWS